MVPSGASTGEYEALELRDHDASLYRGKSVLKAVKNVNNVIAPALIKQKFNITDLERIDAFMNELDGTEDKSKLGANAILGVSMACTRAGAASVKVPLYEYIRQISGSKKPYTMPVPFFNVLNGGVHSGNDMAFQEFMVAPVSATSITEAVRMGAEIYQELKTVITNKFGGSATGVGDEGGFAPPISQPHEALDLLNTAVENCGYTGKIKYAMDPASSEFFQSEQYNLGLKDKKSAKLSRQELADLYASLIEKYPVALLEDPFAQDDWESWTQFQARKTGVELVGDDLLVTNVKRVKIAGEKKACDAMLLKVNQIGTVTEAISAANMAFGLGWSVFVSHRSGETTDDFIADLTVGLQTGHLKTGAPCRGERVAKYNRLMDIEDELKASGVEFKYAGVGFRSAHQL
ncbi:hypothetical protein G7Y89_g10110 [Cudoniella acicularis]|uniref:Enolase n=1 Tax=Cudoniella acicularis TaxID=354080 RepID=A0A8H4RDD6_9HELO|nr:hypothetical protein G7Y89_g10110 [Cudoniella acicularis]